MNLACFFPGAPFPARLSRPGVRPCTVLLLAALVWLSMSSAFAGEGLDRLKAFYSDVQSLRADFVQRQGAPGKPAQETHGTLRVQRPGKFRWDYAAPYEQTIVADGRRLWIYDVDLEQVTVKTLGDALGDTPALLLSGKRPLEESFKIADSGSRDGLAWVELLPKRQDASFERVRLGFGPKTLQVMQLTDGLGQETHLRFENMQYNARLDSKLFKFTPPAGIDVIGDDE